MHVHAGARTPREWTRGQLDQARRFCDETKTEAKTGASRAVNLRKATSTPGPMLGPSHVQHRVLKTVLPWSGGDTLHFLLPYSSTNTDRWALTCVW